MKTRERSKEERQREREEKRKNKAWGCVGQDVVVMLPRFELSQFLRRFYDESCQEAASGVKKDSQEKATGFWIFVTLSRVGAK